MRAMISFIIVMYPILSIYRSPIKGVDFGTFAILVTSPLIFARFTKHLKIKINHFMLALILYTFIDFILAYTLSSPTDIIMQILRLGKFVIILCIVFLIANYHVFDYNLAKKYLKIITFITTFIIIIQNIAFYVGNKYISLVAYNYIMNESYINSIIYPSLQLYRPTSLFLEPAHFSQYNILYLCYSLFGDHQNRKSDLKLAIFITVGLLLSTSGQGILLCTLLWFIWFLNIMLKSKIDVIKKLLLLILVIVFVVYIIPQIFNLYTMQESIYRVWDFEKGEPGPALSGRIFTYSYFNELPLLYKLIGVGFGNVPKGVYFNGISYILYTIGVIGLFIVMLLLLNAFIHTRNFQRCFCLIYFLLLIGSQTFTAVNIVFYFAFIYCGYQRHKNDFLVFKRKVPINVNDYQQYPL
jgi:hypothetical protein